MRYFPSTVSAIYTDLRDVFEHDERRNKSNKGGIVGEMGNSFEIHQVAFTRRIYITGFRSWGRGTRYPSLVGLGSNTRKECGFIRICVIEKRGPMMVGRVPALETLDSRGGELRTKF